MDFPFFRFVIVLFLFEFLFDDVRADVDAFIADIDAGRSRDQLPHLVLCHAGHDHQAELTVRIQGIDAVVLKQNAAEERTSSGIFLTASAQEKPEVYEVVEVGPGGLVDGNEVKMIVEAGQKVLVGKYSGSKVKLDDEEYTIVRQSDILAVIE